MSTHMSQSLLGEEPEKRKMSLRMAHVLSLWNGAEERRDYNFFKNLELAKDGGMNDVTPEKLLYSTQYVNAGMSVLFILMNLLYVNYSDYNCVFHGYCGQAVKGMEAEAACIQSRIHSCLSSACIWELTSECQAHPTIPQPFMVSRALLFDEVPSERIIACIEFFGLWVLIIRMVRMATMATCASMEVFRWVCVSKIFWQMVPSLSSFSLLKLLYYVTPSVIGTEAYYVFTWTTERIEQDGERNWANTWPMVRYVLTRLGCAIVGFDVFLLKYRMASHGVLDPNAGIIAIVGAVVFMLQVLGVVNLTWFVRQRLFLFIFGGENGDMSNEQKAREIVWNAMIARRVFDRLGFFRFLVVMLGFDDYDFQVLVMEKAKPVEMVAKCTRGHPLQVGRTPAPRCDVCGKWFPPFSQLWGCRRCSFDTCERCKFDVLGAPKERQMDEPEGLYERFQAWQLGKLVE